MFETEKENKRRRNKEFSLTSEEKREKVFRRVRDFALMQINEYGMRKGRARQMRDNCLDFFLREPGR